MTVPAKSPEILRFAEQAQRGPTRFSLAPDAPQRQAIARALGIEAIRKLTFTGTLTPEGTRDWRIDAKLGATVVQGCVVTLAPVTTRIDISVTRRFVADLPDMPEEEETPMPEDETLEQLGDSVDLAQVMTEALTLALPDYPRADGAELDEAVFAPPGTDPLRDSDLKPFAGLAALKSKLEDDGK